MYIGLHVKCPLCLSDCNETWIFSRDFRNIFEYKISWKFIQCEQNCSTRTDGQTDITNLIVAFRNIANARKKRNRMYEMKEKQLLEQTKAQSDVVRISSKPKKESNFNLTSLADGATGCSIHSCGFIMLQPSDSHNSSQLRAADLRTRASRLEWAVGMKDELRWGTKCSSVRSHDIEHFSPRNIGYIPEIKATRAWS